MNSSFSTFQMVVPPDDILSLLTPGAVKAMVSGDVCSPPSTPRTTRSTQQAPTPKSTKTKIPASSDSSNALFTVLTYPCIVRNRRTDDLYISSSNEFFVYDGSHHLLVRILDNKNTLSEAFVDFGNVISTNHYHLKGNCAVIRIKSYVTSLANANQNEPIVCLTGIELYEHDLLKATSLPSNPSESMILTQMLPPGIPFASENGRVMGGKFVDFLTNIAPFLSFDALSGCQDKSTPTAPYSPSLVEKENKRKLFRASLIELGGGRNRDKIDASFDDTTMKLDVVSSFLSRHQATKTLASSLAQEENAALAQLPSSITLHMSVVESFYKSQLDRHKASITANAGRAEPTLITTKIIEQHHNVLEEIYQNRIPLGNQSTANIHINTLHYCHRKLCQDLIPDPGQFRKKTVRVATTSFVYDGKLEGIVPRLLLSLHNLNTRLTFLNYDTARSAAMVNHASPSNGACTLSTTNHSFHGVTPRGANQIGQEETRSFEWNSHRTTEQRRVLATITYAAAVCMGILDTHPYSDGNGRLARVMLNFVLYHELHLPFPIPLFATPEQRLEYTRAICKTRQNIALLPVGEVPDDILLEAYEYAGVLQPMVDLILERFYKSVTEFNKQIIEKVSVHSEEVDLRTARSIRQRSLSTGSCHICFENTPNMSTLCCGTVFHMKCLAQWLRNNSTCPQCRLETPRLETNLSTDLNRIVELFSDIIPTNFNEYSDDTLDSALVSILQERINDRYGIASSNNDDNSDDNDTEEDEDDNNTEEVGDENDTEDQNYTTIPEPPPDCRYCNNISARDCSNQLCARCCRNIGEEQCARHYS